MISKRQRLINGLERGELFFSVMAKVGIILLLTAMVMSSLSFWFLVYTYYEPLQQSALLMLKVFGFSAKFFGFSALVVICLKIIISYLLNKEMKQIEDEWKKKKLKKKK